MQLFSLETGNLMLDGGAMFGVVPKSMWEKLSPGDNQNRIKLAMRSLFIIDDNRKILIDTGVGNKQEESFFSQYQVTHHPTLISSLKEIGYNTEDITDIILTHLHFDHCGGCLQYTEDKKNIIPVFPNATIHISRAHWEWAINPNRLERASFLKENILPLKTTGKLNLIEQEGPLTPNISIRFFNGHTEGQQVVFIHYNNRILVHIADVIPLASQIPVSFICAYDTRPLISTKEKEEFLTEAFQHNYTLYFGHDMQCECCTLRETSRGIRADKKMSLQEWINLQ